MAKRFITTDIFEDAWFMDLPGKYKLFWIYLITRCDHSGIWQVNWKLAQFYTGDNLEPTEIMRYLKDRFVEIEDGKYWFIPKFLEFQYKGELNKSNPAHFQIIENVNKYKLFEFLGKTKIIQGAKKELKSTYEGDKDKDMDMDMDMDKEEDNGKIWVRIFLKNPGAVELKFVKDLVDKFGIEKASKILFNFREQNFHSIKTMREALNPDGTIKPRENGGKAVVYNPPK